MSETLQRLIIAVSLFFALILMVRLQSKGIKLSFDLGNAMVGIGGFALAFATWRATSDSNRIVREQQDRQTIQKLSEFRLNWVESLREHIALFHSELEMTRQQHILWLGAHGHGDFERANEFDRAKLNHIARTQYEIAFVELMLNKNEYDHNILLEIMDKNLKNTILGINDSKDEIGDHEINLTDQARKILKFEWDRISTMSGQGE